MKRETNTWTLPKNKKLWNMKVTVIPVVNGALGTVLKGSEEFEIRRRIETIQITALLKFARILRRIPKTSRDLLSLKLH